MRVIDRYIYTQLLTLFVFFSLVLVSVYWVNRAVGLFDQLITGGQSAQVFFEFTTLALPTVIAAVLPVSALIATIYGINRLSADSELVIGQTSGLSPWALARPIVLFSLTVFLITSVFLHLLKPAAVARLADRSTVIAKDITSQLLQAGQFIHPGGGVTVYVREITERGELKGLLLDDRRTGTSSTLYVAESAVLVETEDAPRLIMFNGAAQTLEINKQNLTNLAFDDFTYDLTALTPDVDRDSSLEELSTARLFEASHGATIGPVAGLTATRYNLHIRFADPLFTAALPLLALGVMMIGGFSRFGLWRQIVCVVIVTICAHMLSGYVKSALLQDAEKWAWLYLPAMIPFLVGIGALAWASGTQQRGMRPRQGLAAP